MLLRAISLSALAMSLCLAVAPSARAEGGHQVRLLEDGRTSFAERAHNLREADVIFYKTYIFAGDATGRETLALLAERARAGAKVFVQYDVRGTLSSAFRQLAMVLDVKATVPAYLQPLVDAGVTLLPVNAPTWRRPFLGRDHEKMLVTWKRGEAAKAIVGGMNIGDAWANSGYLRDAPKTTGHLDTDLAMSGPQVAKVVDRFIAAARSQKLPIAAMSEAAADMARSSETYAAQREGSHARFFTNDPKDGVNPRRLERLYGHLLARTPFGETVTISNAYLVPSKSFREQLITAGNRGVKIRLLVNGENAPESPARLTAHALRSDLRTLFKKMPAGSLEVFEWNGDKNRNEGSIHQKVASFGKSGPVLVGSFNLDSLSADTNSEEATLVSDPHVRRQFDVAMDRAFRSAKPLTARALNAQPLWKKVQQRFIRTVLHHIL